MLMLTLAISCLTTSICLDSWTWHSRFLCNIALYSIDPCLYHLHTGYCFCFGSIPSFFLELFLHWACCDSWGHKELDMTERLNWTELNWSPVAYWAPTNLGSSPFSILSFCLFILFMEFSRQEYWSGLPFSSPVDHILSDLSTMTRPSWVAPHGMA